MAAEEQVFLLVDDDDDFVAVAQHCMEQLALDHRLARVAGGGEALDYLFRRNDFTDGERHPLPRLVLLDIRMPGMDGFEVLHAVRQNAATACVPIVMLTSSESRRDMERAYRGGANGFVVKPATLRETRELFGAIGAFWGRHNRFRHAAPAPSD